MSNALRTTRDHVALEAFSATNVADLLQTALPAIREEYALLSGGQIEQFAPIAFAPNTTDFKRAIEHAPYVDLMPLTVSVPDGLRGTYLGYLETLHAAATYSLDVMSRVLSPYSLFLSALVNSHDSVISTARIDQGYEAIARERSGLKNAFEALTPASAEAQSTATYGDVVERNADWEGVFSATDAVVVMASRVNRSDLQAKVEEIIALHEVLERKLARGELDDITPEVINNIVSGANEACEELAFFMATYCRAQLLSCAITTTVQRVTQILTETA